jgi:hypothetical protein
MKAHAVLAAGLLLVGCGGEDGTRRASAGTFQGDQTCGLRVALGGGIAAAYAGADTEFACAFPVASSGIQTSYIAVDGALGQFELDAEGITQGMTARELPAVVRLTARGEGSWGTEGCSIDVEENVYLRPGELGDLYRVVGSGRCDAPAEPLRSGDPVTIAPFDFVLTMAWLGGS